MLPSKSRRSCTIASRCGSAVRGRLSFGSSSVPLWTTRRTDRRATERSNAILREPWPSAERRRMAVRVGLVSMPVSNHGRRRRVVVAGFFGLSPVKVDTLAFASLGPSPHWRALPFDLEEDLPDSLFGLLRLGTLSTGPSLSRSRRCSTSSRLRVTSTRSSSTVGR